LDFADFALKNKWVFFVLLILADFALDFAIKFKKLKIFFFFI